MYIALLLCNCILAYQLYSNEVICVRMWKIKYLTLLEAFIGKGIGMLYQPIGT